MLLGLIVILRELLVGFVFIFFILSSHLFADSLYFPHSFWLNTESDTIFLVGLITRFNIELIIYYLITTSCVFLLTFFVLLLLFIRVVTIEGVKVFPKVEHVILFVLLFLFFFLFLLKFVLLMFLIPFLFFCSDLLFSFFHFPFFFLLFVFFNLIILIESSDLILKWFFLRLESTSKFGWIKSAFIELIFKIFFSFVICSIVVILKIVGGLY